MDESSSVPEIPRYRPGDTVTMDVEIAHRAMMNISSVEVRFEPESAEGIVGIEPHLMLTGVPQLSNEQPESDGTRWSVARTTGEISLEHTPGVYTFLSFIVNTVGGSRILLHDDEITMGLFDRSLEVVRETGKPEIMRGRFVNTSPWRVG